MKNPIYNIYKQLYDMEQSVNNTEIKPPADEWTILDESDYSIVKDKLDQIIIEYNLKCEETETLIDGQKYTVENWVTESGEMVIQRIYLTSDKEKIKKPDKIKELQDQLDQALSEEEYEKASEILIELNKLR